MDPLRDCCAAEATESLESHRDVATCDECGSLLLAYGNEEDYRSTIEELERMDASFQAGTAGELRVVAKQR